MVDPFLGTEFGKFVCEGGEHLAGRAGLFEVGSRSGLL